MNKKTYVFTFYTSEGGRREYRAKAEDFETAKVVYKDSQERKGSNIDYKTAEVIEQGKRVKIK